MKIQLLPNFATFGKNLILVRLQILEKKLIAAFKGKGPFTSEELFQFYRDFEPELKKATFRSRVHYLKKKNIIHVIKRGVYVIVDKPEYAPSISSGLRKVGRSLASGFDQVRYCIWETAWLNEFTRHQLTQSTIFIEVEKDFEEEVFYFIKDKFPKKEVFLKPNGQVIDFYISESIQPLIVKRLISRAPLTKRTIDKTTFAVPTLEKILVDLFVEKRFFYYLQGSELIEIYENAIGKYRINFTRLFGYARRRVRAQEIKDFMRQHVYHLVKDIIDD